MVCLCSGYAICYCLCMWRLHLCLIAGRIPLFSSITGKTTSVNAKTKGQFTLISLLEKIFFQNTNWKGSNKQRLGSAAWALQTRLLLFKRSLRNAWWERKLTVHLMSQRKDIIKWIGLTCFCEHRSWKLVAEYNMTSIWWKGSICETKYIEWLMVQY